MNFSALESRDKRNEGPILIVDKTGVIGEELAKEFCKDYLVVLVSLENKISNKNLIHLLFNRKIPKVPDNHYSKIFIVDDKEVITRKSISSFVTKAKDVNAPFFFISSIRNVNTKQAEDIARSYAFAKVLIHGDLFDDKLLFEKDLSITKYIIESRANQRIDVLGNGLSLNFPITFEDTVKLIIKASLINIPQRIILLFSPHPITDISLANTFQKVNPDIKVDFIKGKGDKKILIPKDSQYALGKYDLEARIKNLNLGKNENSEIKIPKNKKRKKINLLKPLIFTFLLFLFMVLLPLGAVFAYSFLASSQLNEVKTLAQNDDLDSALKKARNSITFYDTSLKISDIVLMEGKFLNREKESRIFIKRIDGAKSVSLAAVDFLEGLKSIKKVYSRKSTDPRSDFSSALNSLKNSIAIIQKTKAEGNLDKNLEKKLKEIEPFVDLFSNSSDELIDALGFQKEKKYLVLFQNNINLRPGGGTIEGYGILKIKDGRISSLSVYKSSQIDEKQKDRIEPPFPLRRYLGLKNLSFKDSGFDPDFVNNAISASNIYSISTGDKVNGVIGVDLYFARNLLSATGPVTIPNSQKMIDEGNFYQIARESKDDILADSAKSIEKSLTNKKNISDFILAEEVGKSIREKHLLFAFQNTSQQKIFTVNGWSGALWDNRSSEKGKINDFLGISEANMGGNGANYFVSRSVLKKLVILDDGKVTSKLKIVFNNRKKDDKSNGNYKNYLQLILPSGARILDISIDDKKVEIKKAVSDFRTYESVNFRPPQGFEVDEGREMEKSVFGFLLGIGPMEVKSITISYILPYSVSSADKSINYSLKVYKQPGIDSYPLNLTFSLPYTYQILGGKESNLENISSDEDFSFTFSQK